jgi:hypothetical protein
MEERVRAQKTKLLIIAAIALVLLVDHFLTGAPILR